MVCQAGVDEVSSDENRSWACGVRDEVGRGRCSVTGETLTHKQIDSRTVAKFSTDLDEEKRSIGGGVAIDVNPSQDDGCYQEDGQHDAHDGTQVHWGALCLGGQVVLKACEETIRAGRGYRGAGKAGP